jgi:hypothetical protein
MRTALTILVFAAVVGGSFGSAGEAAPARDTEQLFADLRNDQFDVRKNAAEELSRNAGQFWDRLKKMSEADADPDVRTQALNIMAAPAQEYFKSAWESAKKEAEGFEKELQEQRKKYEAATKEFAEKGSAPAAEREAAEKKLAETTRAWEGVQAGIKKKRNEFKVKIARCGWLTTENLIIPPAELPGWTPAKLPIEKRMQLKVSFNFEDAKFKDALEFVESSIFTKIEVAPNFADNVPNINLSITDMSADLALDWMLKLCGATKKLSAEGDRIIIDSP